MCRHCCHMLAFVRTRGKKCNTIFHKFLLRPLSRYSPITYANINGATIDASELIINFGASRSSFHHVIFSFGTAPEYEPNDVVESEI